MASKQKLTFANNLEESMYLYVFAIILWHNFTAFLFNKKDT